MQLFKKLRFSHMLLGLSFGVVGATASAVSTIDGEVNGDLYFPDGVLIMGVEKPDASVKTTGSSKVTIGGSGTITVGNKRGGGLPRITLLGGTTVTSTRAWTEDQQLRISWWEGQFSAPGKARMPQNGQIDYPNMSATSKLQALDAFGFGLINESFSFSPAATVAFGVTESDGKKLWVAFQGADGKWKIDGNSSCVVKDQVCITSIKAASAIALVREVYGSCPISSIENGKISSPPSCAITCKPGFQLEGDKSCVKITEEMKAAAAADNSQYGGVQERKQYTYRQGYFRYSGTREPEMRRVAIEGEVEREKSLNLGSLMRNPRSKEEQLIDRGVNSIAETESQRDSFLNYMQQMRNKFGEGSAANTVASMDNNEEGDEEEYIDGEVNNDNEEDVTVNSKYHSSGVPLLPSTGPELFIAIAVIGLFVMIVAARRRQQ